MIKKCFLFLLLFSGYCVQSQELFFSTGKNFTSYDYKNSAGFSNPNLRSGDGSFYQAGMDFKLNKSAASSKVSYAISVIYNQFNAVGGTSSDDYSWKTNYLGVQNHGSNLKVDSFWQCRLNPNPLNISLFSVKSEPGFVIFIKANSEKLIGKMNFC